MNQKTFFAKDMKEALKMVRDTLGADAIILSNKTTDSGVELTASDTLPQSRFLQEHTTDSFEALKQEVESLSQIIKTQMSYLAFKEDGFKQPLKSVLHQKLMDYGYCPGTIKEVLEGIQESHSIDVLWHHLKIAIANRITINETRFESPGVHLFIGGSGSGKTSTIVKIASTLAMGQRFHLSADLQLVGIEGNKVGGLEELKKYAHILGAPFEVVNKHHTLSELLCEIENKKVVLVDTPSFQDKNFNSFAFQVIKQWKETVGEQLKVHLMLPAHVQLGVLKHQRSFYSGLSIDDGILTKLDESAVLGPVISFLMQENISTGYASCGVEIPYDLMAISAMDLTEKSLHSEEAVLRLNDCLVR